MGNLTDDFLDRPVYTLLYKIVGQASKLKKRGVIVKHSLPWWVRATLLFIALQAFDFLRALIWPDMITALEPWPASPLNAGFIAALYLATGIGVLLAGLARNYLQARIMLISIGLATTVILFVSLFRLFTYPREFSPFPYLWFSVYFIDPLLVGVGLWYIEKTASRPAPPTTRRDNIFAPLWAVEALILAAIGLPMLLLPGLAVQVWPWALTEPLAQLYGAFFFGLAIMSAFSLREYNWEAVRISALVLMSLGVLVVFVSLLHLDRFKSPLETLIWFSFFSATALCFGALVLVRQARPQVKGAIS